MRRLFTMRRRSHVRLDDVVELWSAGLGEAVGERWQATRLSEIKHVQACLGNPRLDRLTKADIWRLQRYLVGRGLAESTINKITHDILAAAIRDGGVDTDVLTATRQLRVRAAVATGAWTAAERDLILEAAPRVLDRHGAAFVGLAFHTGARLEELLALCWRSVYVEERYIRIEGSRHDSEITGGKTRRAQRDVPLSRTARAVLSTLRRTGHDDFVLLSPKGRPLNLGNFRRRRWPLVIGELNGDVRPLWLRCARHTLATCTLETGVTISEVANILGIDPRTVLDRYVRPNRRLAELLDQAIPGPGPRIALHPRRRRGRS